MTLATVGLKTAIWNNNIKSFFLLALYPLIIAGLVWAVAALYGSVMTSPGAIMYPTTADPALIWQNGKNFANRTVIEYLPVILAVVAGWFAVALFFHTHMIRSLSHAHPVTRAQEPELYNLLENLCITRGLTMPKLEVIEAEALNAFASGIGPRSYTVTVSRGLINRLDHDEMETVLAHELTHIMNRDVRLLVVSVIFTGMVGFCAQMVWSTLRHSLFRRRSYGSSGRRRGGTDPRLLIFVLLLVLILWIGYLATLFTRFAISRRREFMADAGAVELTKKPEALMRALMKISGHDRLPATPADIDMMCIENTQPFFGVFATHPPVKARLEALSALSGAPLPDPAAARQPNPWKR